MSNDRLTPEQITAMLLELERSQWDAPTYTSALRLALRQLQEANKELIVVTMMRLIARSWPDYGTSG